METVMEVSNEERFEKMFDERNPNPSVFANLGPSVITKKAEKKDGVWYNPLGQEATEEFPQISKIWQDQCVSVLDLINKVNEEHKYKRDTIEAISSVRLNDELQLETNNSPFTPFAFRQLATYTDVNNGCLTYLSEHLEYRPTLAHILNEELGSKSGDIMFRYRDEDIIRSVVSNRYGIIDNKTVLQWVVDGLPKGTDVSKLLSSHQINDGDRIFTNILFPKSLKSFPESDYLPGVTISNSEIGDGSFNINAFLCKAICMNGCIWDCQKSEGSIRKKHLGQINESELVGKVRYQIEMALSEGYGLCMAMQEVKEIEVTKIKEIIVDVSERGGLTQHQTRKVFQAWKEFSPALNALSIVDAFTKASQIFGDSRVPTEKLAGKILTPYIPPIEVNGDYRNDLHKHWRNIEARASVIDKEKINKVLALA